jgi:hypothetical protein
MMPRTRTLSITERMATPPNIRIMPLSNTSGESETFPACLLVMDDNHRLVEWLAHHFHVLKLRTLIATTDSRSQTSPTAIFDKWRAHGMNIIEWIESHLEIQVETSNNSYRLLDYLVLDYLTLSPKRTTKITVSWKRSCIGES